MAEPELRSLRELRDDLHAELAMFIDRNRLDGTPPTSDPLDDEAAAQRLANYGAGVQLVANLAAAIADLTTAMDPPFDFKGQRFTDIEPPEGDRG